MNPLLSSEPRRCSICDAPRRELFARGEARICRTCTGVLALMVAPTLARGGAEEFWSLRSCMVCRRQGGAERPVILLPEDGICMDCVADAERHFTFST
jgi:hypothetical protein